MKCPYCAEEIKDAAILCRFCGARRSRDGWDAPLYAPPIRAPQADAASKTSFTIASSGWLLMASGAGSLFSLTSPVPLWGSVHEGAIAVLYNLTFAALFAGMGYALAYRKRWALPVTSLTSTAYTLDKLEIIFDENVGQALLAKVDGALGELGEIGELGAIGDLSDLAPMLRQALVLTSVILLALWWGFVAYLFFKRSYFQPVPSPAPDPIDAPGE